MDCLSIPQTLKINKNKSIGTVVIVVEGADYEFKILKRIFHDILGYTYITKSRNKKRIKEYNEFTRKENRDSRVIVLNTSNSNIDTIATDIEYKEFVYNLLLKKYRIDPKNVPIYFLWDRDCCSNKQIKTKQLLESLCNSYDNPDFDINGLLLLNYPCVESFTISNFYKNAYKMKITKLKDFVKSNQLYISKINDTKLLNAAVNMHSAMISLGIKYYNLDNFKVSNLKIFGKQEEIFARMGSYKILSMLSIILIDLGIICRR